MAPKKPNQPLRIRCQLLVHQHLPQTSLRPSSTLRFLRDCVRCYFLKYCEGKAILLGAIGAPKDPGSQAGIFPTRQDGVRDQKHPYRQTKHPHLSVCRANGPTDRQTDRQTRGDNVERRGLGRLETRSRKVEDRSSTYLPLVMALRLSPFAH